MPVKALNAAGRSWSCSGGGLVIGVPAEHAAVRKGAAPPVGVAVPDGWRWGKSGGPVCDYDKACEPEGVIRSGYGGADRVALTNGERGIVFEGELIMEWLSESSGATLIRGASQNSPLEVPADTDFQALGELTLKEGRFFVFDIAFPGASDSEQIQAHDGVAGGAPPLGRYGVSFATTARHVAFIRLRPTL